MLAGCAPDFVSFSAPCVLAAEVRPLPAVIDESSGLVASPNHPGVYWTHNDSGNDPILFAVEGDGTLLGSVWVEGARNRDWEDLALGPCGGVGAESCLYIADTGDNREHSDEAAIYRIPEPHPGDERSHPAERFPLRFPDGPRDVEAVYLLPGERLFLVTKGRRHRVEVYRVPAPLGAPILDEGVPRDAKGVDAAPDLGTETPLILESIQFLTARSPSLPRHVTGGSATPDGELVALRTYETLQFYLPDADGRLEPLPGGLVNLRPLRERQGEAVAFVPGQRIVLTSEAGPGANFGSITRLACPGLGVAW